MNSKKNSTSYGNMEKASSNTKKEKSTKNYFETFKQATANSKQIKTVIKESIPPA